MNLRPLHDRVIVKRLDQETKTAVWHRHPRQLPPRSPIKVEVLAIGKGKRQQEDGKIRRA